MTPFGLTTTLFGASRLGAAELQQIAAHGFGAVELVARAGHFDLGDSAQVGEVIAAAAAGGLTIAGVSVPAEAAASALPVASEAGWPRLTLRTGPCQVYGDNWKGDIGALHQLLDTLLGVRERTNGQTRPVIALDAPGGSVAAGAIVGLIESLDDPSLGISLNVGHANLDGDIGEMVEALSGYVVAAELHDNNGREDSHRAPFSGSIDWASALMALWKTGYAGPWLIDPGADAGPTAVLAHAVGARNRLQAILEDLARPFAFTE